MELEQIGRYQIHNRLGQGGMGIVYRGYDPLIDRWVAIKRLPIQDPLQRARFHQEIQAAGKLIHPHIVTVFDVGSTDDGSLTRDRHLGQELAYIVMELIEGGPLSTKEPSVVPWREAIRLLYPICQALVYAHQQGVIHRDVKPANILLSTKGQTKLTDFGIARLNLAPRLTPAGNVTGTPHYAAPEQIQDKAIDGRADLFALGIILYELITGEHPFAGATLYQMFYRLTQPEPIDLTTLDNYAPQQVVSVVAQALEKDPAKRFPDAEAMRTALEVCLDESVTPITLPLNVTVDVQPTLDYAPSDLNLSSTEKTLLYTAFVGHDKIYLKQELKGGFSGARVILAVPVRSGHDLSKVVLKFDTVSAIEREWQAYQTHVADILPATTAKIINPPVYAADQDCALLWYTYVGDLGTALPESLKDYYAGHQGSEVSQLLERAVFKPFGEQWWLHRASTTIAMRQEYDRYLPVHLVMQSQAKVDSTATILAADKVNSYNFQTLQRQQTIRLENFTVAEIDANQQTVTLQAFPASGSLGYLIRVRVIKPLPALLEYQVGDRVAALDGNVVFTRHDLLCDLVQPSFPRQDLEQPTITIEERLYPNPLFDYNTLLDYLLTTMQATIHGDLNLQNILVTPGLNIAWLIDFATARSGHALADLLRLETQVLTKLIPTVDCSPNDIALLMHVLACKAPYPNDLPEDLEKPFIVLTTIRQMATDCLHDRLNWDEYYLGLILMLLGALKFKELDQRTRQLTFTAAATIRSLIKAETLHTPNLPEPALSLSSTSSGRPALSQPWIWATLVILLFVGAISGWWFWPRLPFTSILDGIGPPTSQPVVVVVPTATTSATIAPTTPPTRSSTLTNTVTPTRTPTSMPSPSATATSTLTPSPSSTATPTLPNSGQALVRGPLDVYNGPGLRYPPIGSIPDGNPVSVLGQRKSDQTLWWQIAYPGGDGGYGWIVADSAQPLTVFVLPEASAQPPPTSTPTSTPPFTATPTATPFTLTAYHLLFASNITDEYRIYWQPLTAEQPIPLTHGPGHEARPDLSPNGQELAFASTRYGKLNIFVLNLTTNELKQLTTHPEHDHTPVWSPNGQQIAFESERAGNFDIYLMNADGSNLTALTDSPADDRWPTWSPDGQQILFESQRDTLDQERSQLYLMNRDGSDQVRILVSENHDIMPVWSSRGQIVFSSDQDGDPELYLLTELTAAPEQLTDNETNDWLPAWSPDGHYLVYASGELGEGEIFVMDMNNRQITPLAQNDGDISDPILGVSVVPTLVPALAPALPQAIMIESFDHYQPNSVQSHYALNNAWEKNAIAITIADLNEPNHGKVLALTYDIKAPAPDNYVGFEQQFSVPQDWSAASTVQFWVRNDATPKDITFQWGELRAEVWKTTLTLSPHETRLVEVPLNNTFFTWADWSPYQNGRLDRQQVNYIGFFMAQTPGQGTIYVDDLTLLTPVNDSPLSDLQSQSNITAISISCSSDLQPSEAFQTLWLLHATELGCVQSELIVIPTIASEQFQRGHLFWRNDTDDVYVIYDRSVDGRSLLTGQWSQPQPKWDGSNPDGVGMTPPAPFVEPKRGFGWLWRTHLGGPNGPLGWAVEPEKGFDNVGRAQFFAKGIAFKGQASKVYALLFDGRFFAYEPN